MTVSEHIHTQLMHWKTVGQPKLVGSFSKGKVSYHDVDIIVTDIMHDDTYVRDFMLRVVSQFYDNTNLILHIYAYGVQLDNAIFPIINSQNIVIGILRTAKPWYCYLDQLRARFVSKQRKHVIVASDIHCNLQAYSKKIDQRIANKQQIIEAIQAICATEAMSIALISKALNAQQVYVIDHDLKPRKVKYKEIRSIIISSIPDGYMNPYLELNSNWFRIKKHWWGGSLTSYFYDYYLYDITGTLTQMTEQLQKRLKLAVL